jgi:hypothetical protein
MRLRRAFLVVAVTLLAAACSGSGGSPSTPPGSPPVADTYWLRMATTQALPPLNVFGRLPVLVVTGDGIAVTGGPMMEIYPGPLMPNLTGRPLSGAGQAAIIQAASDLGLLAGNTDFSGGAAVPGGIMGQIEISVDGRRVTLTGNPSAQIVCVTTPCNPAPGSPEAFGELWRHLEDLPGWLGADLGPETPYVAPAYALLVGPAPQPEPGSPQAPADWPLATPLATFGGPVANGTARCGTVSGVDAETLRPVLAAANVLTPWIEDPDTSAGFGLTVRPMVPGEDVCRQVFGPA